jgi:hypothetical protein
MHPMAKGTMTTSAAAPVCWQLHLTALTCVVVCCGVLCCAVLLLCFACSGFGSTDANPKMCSQCPLGTFNEGPLPRAEQPEAPVSLKQQRSSSSSSSRRGSATGQGRLSSTTDGTSHGAADGSSVLAAAPTGDASSQGVHSNNSPYSPVLGSLLKFPQQQQQQQQSQGNSSAGLTASAAAVAVAAAVRPNALLPQQFTNSWGWLVNSGVNPVFYEPTFNPCTPCGPACWTDSPGAISPSQCGEGEPRCLQVQQSNQCYICNSSCLLYWSVIQGGLHNMVRQLLCSASCETHEGLKGPHFNQSITLTRFEQTLCLDLFADCDGAIVGCVAQHVRPLGVQCRHQPRHPA